MLKKSASGVLAGHCRLTASPARTNVALFIHRAVRLISLRVEDLTAALFGDMRVLARLDESARVDESARRAKRARRGGRVRINSLFEHPEFDQSSFSADC